MPEPRTMSDRRLHLLTPEAKAFVLLPPLALVAVSFLARVSWRWLDRSVIQLFDVMAERNIPTWYATMLLMGSALASWLVARLIHGADGRVDRRVWSWRALSLLFLAMSVDELVGVHERAGRWLRPIIAPRVRSAAGDSLDWLLATAWILPGLVAVVLVLLGVALWYRYAPPPIRRLTVAGLLVLLAGALGMELVGSLVYHQPIPLLIAGHVEELLELVGTSVIALAITSLFRVRTVGGSLTVDLPYFSKPLGTGK